MNRIEQTLSSQSDNSPRDMPTFLPNRNKTVSYADRMGEKVFHQ